jgi:hypothetical protein
MNRLLPFLCAGVLLSCSACGLGLMQTAKTTPAGKVRVTLANGYLYNEMVDERGSGLTNFPAQLAARYGVTDTFDVGLQVFLGGGLAGDVKYNFLDADSDLALALQVGLGAARNWFIGSTGMVFQFPLRLIFSARLFGLVTPYAGLGYQAMFIYGYEGDNPELDNVARDGFGDGLLTAHLGLELFSSRRVQLLVEYTYWHPVRDDPGDRFSFVDNHIVMAGLRF